MGSADLMDMVKTMDEALARQDVNILREQVFATGVEWVVPGRHPLAGPKRGVEEIVAYHQLLDRAQVKVEPSTIDAIDAHTVVKIQHVTGGAAGASLDSMELLMYQIDDERVSRVQAFMGDQHPVDLFYWAAFRLKPIPDRLTK